MVNKSFTRMSKALLAAGSLLLPLLHAADGTLVGDTYFSAGVPGPNGATTTMIVLNGSPGLVQFDLSAVPPGSTVSSAYLRVYVNKLTAAGALSFYQITSPWTENTATFSTAPTVAGSAFASMPVTVANSFVLVDVTSLVNGWLASPATNFGIEISGDSTISVQLDTKENTLTSHPAALDLTVVGPSGPAGPSGAAGVTGPLGPSGATGASGPSGAPGGSGPNGPSGAIGASGPSGVPGLPGTAGTTGPSGAAGPSGPIGASGAVGAIGPAGPSGAIGAAGPSGAKGLQGAAGPSGAGPVRSEAGGPSGLAGPSGQAGLGGAQGPPGSGGPSGPTGAQGNTGQAGSAGPNGPSGPSGAAGANGPTSNAYSITAANYNSNVNTYTISNTDLHEVFLIHQTGGTTVCPGGAGCVTVTLPLSTATPAGKRISIFLDNAPATAGQFQVQTQGADQILLDPTLKTLVGPASYCITVVSNGAGLWRIVFFS